MPRARRSAEVERSGDEPFVGLARQLHDEVARIAADPQAGVEAIVEVFDQLPRQARREAAESTFRRLPPERQWEVLERLFGDDELREALEAQRARELERAREVGRRAALVEVLIARQVVDTRLLPDGEHLTLGLFREEDVRLAVPRGRSSSTCARRLVLRATADPGVLQVLEDVFNPAGGLFVTPDYDQQIWRNERLEPHGIVRVGSLRADGPDQHLDPVVHPGGRVDVEIDGTPRPGRLHAGYATVGDDELFVKDSS